MWYRYNTSEQSYCHCQWCFWISNGNTLSISGKQHPSVVTLNDEKWDVTRVISIQFKENRCTGVTSPALHILSRVVKMCTKGYNVFSRVYMHVLTIRRFSKIILPNWYTGTDFWAKLCNNVQSGFWYDISVPFILISIQNVENLHVIYSCS